jgi:hypothetical protein
VNVTEVIYQYQYALNVRQGASVTAEILRMDVATVDKIAGTLFQCSFGQDRNDVPLNVLGIISVPIDKYMQNCTLPGEVEQECAVVDAAYTLNTFDIVATNTQRRLQNGSLTNDQADYLSGLMEPLFDGDAFSTNNSNVTSTTWVGFVDTSSSTGNNSGPSGVQEPPRSIENDEKDNTVGVVVGSLSAAGVLLVLFMIMLSRRRRREQRRREVNNMYNLELSNASGMPIDTSEHSEEAPSAEVDRFVASGMTSNPNYNTESIRNTAVVGVKTTRIMVG